MTSRSTERFRRWAHIVLRRHQLQTIFICGTHNALIIIYCHSHQPLAFSQQQIYWIEPNGSDAASHSCGMSHCDWIAHANTENCGAYWWPKSEQHSLSFAKWKLIVNIESNAHFMLPLSASHQRAKQWKPTEMKQKKNIYQIGCGEQWIECSVIMQNCIHKIKCHTHTQARMIMGDRRHARRVPSRQFIAIEDAHIFFLPFISSSHYRVVRTRHTDAWRHVRHRTYVRHQLHSGGGGDGDGNIAGSIE